ncbi:MAG: hypothetical protein RBS13_02710 [Bacteroidales bacterium]|jgi:hypothetical protein|nr:hypothetical protein [Bacteroidales bacterium]
MALPLFSFIPQIAAFFSSTGPIAAFFIYISKKIGIKTFTLSIQYTLVSVLIVSKLAFVGILVSFVIFIFNRIQMLLDYITELQFDSAFSLPLDILKSMGFFDALSFAFSTFQFVVTTALILFIYKFFLAAVKPLSDELFKLSVLLNQ